MLGLVFLLGLFIGSFLNVVRYRLPIMLQQQWQSEKNISENINLFFPRSHCPNCKVKISVLENIPLVSYIFLKGCCRACRQPIPLVYPLLEIITAFISLFVTYRYGINLITLAALFFSYSLLTLACIDLETFLLPDVMTLSLLWIGLLCNVSNFFTDINSAIFGAMIGYLSLWSVAKIFESLTGKVGMAPGDFKLLAAIGAWLGWQWLAWVVLIASISGAVISLLLIFFKKINRQHPTPFGPYLAFAGWILFITTL